MKPTFPMRQGGALLLSLFAANLACAQALTPAAGRSSDQAIAADHATYAATQERLKVLNAKGIPLRDYFLSKAQCWLDVSLHEYTRNDRSPFPQQALEQSAAIISALETGSTPNPGVKTPLVNDAALVRPDLWARFEVLRKGTGAACAAQRVACGEVELVHAGNELNQQGWRHANPYVQIAEDQLVNADAAAAACPAPGVAAAPFVAPEAPAPAAPLVVQKLSLAADALFRFDQSSLEHLLPAGRARIDRMMADLDKVYARIERISLTGHTDRLGSDAYNQALSERRAATIRAYLTSKGATAQIVSDGKGETQQIEACNGVAPRAMLITCLQPNRRVELEISGVKR